MNEKYLHLIWKSKRLPFHQLKTTCGKSIDIIDVGTYNLASGPDFFNGKIEINQIIYSGNIELHVKSSDWYLHNHHNDKAYNNVILHVVYEYDKEVLIHGVEILTIELKKHIDWKHFNSIVSNNYFQNSIPCINSFELAGSIQVWSQFQSALVSRINRKVHDLNKLHKNFRDVKKVFFIKLANTFGMKVNGLPFEELAISIPLIKWLNLNLSEKLIIAYGVSGFEDCLSSKAKLEWAFLKHKFELSSMNKLSWKFKGLRPFGYPQNRISQFVIFCHFFNWDFSIFNQNPKSISKSIYTIETNEIPIEIEDLLEKQINYDLKKEMLDLVIINVLVPFNVFFQNLQGNIGSIDNVVLLLEEVKSEKNKLINFWKELNLEFRSAADTQSAIEQYNEFCSKKKCMECQISSVLFQQIQ